MTPDRFRLFIDHEERDARARACTKAQQHWGSWSNQHRQPRLSPDMSATPAAPPGGGGPGGGWVADRGRRLGAAVGDWVGSAAVCCGRRPQNATCVLPTDISTDAAVAACRAGPGPVERPGIFILVKDTATHPD
jgi:hypothetical protein